AIVDAIEARDLEGARRRLDRHYEGRARVSANNKTSSNVGGTQEKTV
ncbi:GntR family transcriptional regulator, partial [Rhizobium ruizarguesonis]